MVWTEEMITLARSEWTRGSSASQIAGHILSQCRFHISRNAVIGKLHRLGLTGEHQPADRPKRAAPKYRAKTNFGFERPRFAPRPVIEPDFQPPPPIVSCLSSPEALGYPNRVTLYDLRAQHCRFVVGDVKKHSYFFCGEAIPIGRVSYCEFHHQACHIDRRHLSTGLLPVGVKG